MMQRAPNDRIRMAISRNAAKQLWRTAPVAVFLCCTVSPERAPEFTMPQAEVPPLPSLSHTPCAAMASPRRQPQPTTQEASSQNGDSAEPVDMPRLAADGDWLWTHGQSLMVHFRDGDAKTHAEVEAIANEWTKSANIQFVFVTSLPSPPSYPDISITFNGEAHSSELGRRSLRYTSQGLPSMYLGDLPRLRVEDYDEFRRAVLHEFGHALGFIHEHQRINRPFKFLEDRVIAYFLQKLKWPERKTRNQVLDLLTEYDLRNSEAFDPDSIMTYYIPPEWTEDGYSTPYVTNLSDRDKEASGRFYPGVLSSLGDIPLILQSDARIQSYAIVRRSGRKEVNVLYDWNVSVAGTEQNLDRVAYVEYILHPTFSQRVLVSRDVNSAFEVRNPAPAWGTFEIIANAHLKTGEVVRLTHDIDLCRAYNKSDKKTLRLLRFFSQGPIVQSKTTRQGIQCQ